MSDSRLVGVSCIQPPDIESQPNPEPSQYEMRFGAFIGEQVMQRVMKYAQVTSEHIPDESHFYLTALGVHPDEQRKGYARALLNAVHELSNAYPTSIGVSLDTGNRANVPMYEYFGYRIVAKTKLKELDLWCMFRPNEAQITKM
ncbi:MAG: GNAT family N-acetyltransferase [Chloroflexi bacterium]|nr:GNAT family N-acetyltransferase [Chloroflexota bacterium]